MKAAGNGIQGQQTQMKKEIILFYLKEKWQGRRQLHL